MADEHWAHLTDRSVRSDGWVVVNNGTKWVVYRGDAPDQLWRAAPSGRRGASPFRRWGTQGAAVAAVDREVPLEGSGGVNVKRLERLKREIANKQAHLASLETRIGHLCTQRVDAEDELARLFDKVRTLTGTPEGEPLALDAI